MMKLNSLIKCSIISALAIPLCANAFMIKAEKLLSPAALSCDMPNMLKKHDAVLNFPLDTEQIIFDKKTKTLAFGANKIIGVDDYKLNQKVSKNEIHPLELKFIQSIGRIEIKKFALTSFKSEDGESSGYYYIIMKPNLSDLTDFVKKFNLKSNAENDWGGEGIFEKLPSGNVKVSCTVAG